jgi:hypothetical protein
MKLLHVMLRNNGKRKFEIKMKYEPTSMSDECIYFSAGSILWKIYLCERERKKKRVKMNASAKLILLFCW